MTTIEYRAEPPLKLRRAFIGSRRSLPINCGFNRGAGSEPLSPGDGELRRCGAPAACTRQIEKTP